MITIKEKIQSIRDESENSRHQVMDEIKRQIERLEEAHSHIDDARHEIRHAFIDSNDSEKDMVKNDFDVPLQKIMECPMKGIENIIKILESELEYIDKDLRRDYAWINLSMAIYWEFI